MDNKQIRKRYLSLFLALIMIIGTLPINIFAEGGLGFAPAKGPTGVKDAAPPIESSVSNDSRNAVHAFVGVQTGGDINLPLAGATGKEFLPLEGVKAYFQWFEDGGYVSPIYTAVSDANGRLNIGCTPYIAADGKLIKFDADTTISAGNERYRFWVEQDTIPKGYQLQYITGEQVIFPDSGLPITQGGSGSNTAKNTHENWKILFMQKPKAEMHRSVAKETKVQSKSGGYMTGKVSWDYKSGIGGIHWYDIAQHTEGAEGVIVRASYLSDYAMKKIYSDEMAVKLSVGKPSLIRGSGWTSKLERQLQDEIRKQMKGKEDKWIAETVTAKTNANGEYILQFNGTYGVLKNADAALKSDEYNKYKVGDAAGGIQAGNKWTQEQIDRLGTVAGGPDEGAFDTAKKNEIKHINYDWLFVSTDGTDNLRVMTPYNNNYYTSMNSDWGINAGWSSTGFGVGVTNAVKCILRSDFVFGPGEVDFHITNYDNEANTAFPGDVAQTSTSGLPYSFVSGKYQIVWYGPDGKKIDGKEGLAQQASSTGTLPSAPFDTTGVTKTTEYTAKLHRVDSKGNLQDPIAMDSFTVEVKNYIGSRYDYFEHKNDNPIKGAAYSAENLPAGLSINAGNGTISGKPTVAGLFNVKVTASMDDTDQGKVVGKIEGSRTYKYLITDSPLADGAKGTEYNQKVVPTPQNGYVFKNVTAKFIDGKTIDGLTITGDQIAGTPTAKVDATEEEPNVEVTYDIYRKNDKGEEVLIKQGHVDKVPLVVTEPAQTTADKLTPAYADKAGKAGVEVTTDAPTFTDADGKTTTAPDGTTYTLGDKAPKGATIDADGKVTYTPSEADAGKPVEIPVVVTYPDKSTDNATAKINVEALPDVIDRTGNEDKPTPAGYVRVTFTNGEGVNAIENNKVYDVKEGTKLAADKYPEVTAKSGYENPVWSTPAGTAITADNATITATATKTTPAEDKTSVDTSGKHPVDPTNDKQGTGVVVKNPDNDTIVTAKDEDGKNIPVEINPNTGEIEVTPGTDVDGPITVTITDPDLPGGKTEVVVDVNGHEKGRDDNGNGYPGDNGHIYDHDHNHRWVFPLVPNYSGVPFSNVQPYENTLWYIFTIDSYKYQEVRNKVATDYTMDVTPVIRNNRTMLPLRYVAEALGADVEWDNSTRTARFTKGGLTASIQIDGNEIVLSNGQTVKMDSKPLNINSRILVPVVNVANVFGLTNGNTLDGIDQDIEWDAQERTATIYVKR